MHVRDDVSAFVDNRAASRSSVFDRRFEKPVYAGDLRAYVYDRFRTLVVYADVLLFAFGKARCVGDRPYRQDTGVFKNRRRFFFRPIVKIDFFGRKIFFLRAGNGKGSER